MTDSAVRRVFLLSPANCSGPRAAMLYNPRSKGALARELRSPEGAALSRLFTFLSSLYFRGKVAYAVRFAAPADNVPGVLAIVPGLGLRPLETRVRLSDLRAMGQVEVDANNNSFTAPLRRDAEQLLGLLPGDCELVLLGSIATAKYVDTLLSVFGTRLVFPSEFVGRGDMSRGGLLLRCAREERELDYVPVATSARRGTRATRIALMGK